MNSYIIILTIIFVIITPLTVISSLIAFYVDVSDGIILLSILVFTMTFSIFIVTLRMGEERKQRTQWRRYHQHRNVAFEDPEDHDVNQTPSDTSPNMTGPPNYDQLYPDKTVIMTGSDQDPVFPVTTPDWPWTSHFHPQPFQVNQNEPGVHLPSPLLTGNSAGEYEDGLPTYSEAIRMSKEMHP